MKMLNEDIQTGQYKHIYLLCGDEDYLKKLYKDKLTKGICQDENSMNYNYFDGKGAVINQIISLADTIPFFAPRRLIVMENTGVFKKANVELAEYLPKLPDTTHIIFVEDEIDKRGKLYKTVKDQGRIVEFGMQDTNTLCKWMAGIFKNEGKQIREKTLHYMVQKIGEDMNALQKEVEKLVCYTRERSVVTEEDVDAICIEHISNRIFDMVNAVAEKRQKQALEYYYDLLALKEPPMRILYLLTRQFRILYQVKNCARSGYSNKEMASKLGIAPFAVNKSIGQAKQFKGQMLRDIIEDAADIEESVKTGRLTDKLAVELFIVKYSMA